MRWGALDGSDDGLPGSNFVATFGRSGVSGDAVELARAKAAAGEGRRHRRSLAAGELSGARRAVDAHRDAVRGHSLRQPATFEGAPETNFERAEMKAANEVRPISMEARAILSASGPIRSESAGK